MDNLTEPFEKSAAEALIQQVSNHWWLLLIRGILLIMLGGYAFAVPGQTLAAYAFVLGIFALTDGLLTLVFAATHQIDNKSWTLLRGALTFFIGLFIVAHPLLMGAMVALTLVCILAINSLISGSMEIYVAIRDRKAIQGEGWMMLSGAFSILFGIVLFSAPIIAAALFIQIAGVMAIIFGFVAIFAAFRFKSLKGK